MSELAVTLLRFSYLLLLWIFILIALSVLRRDIYGTRITRRESRAARAKVSSPASGFDMPMAPPVGPTYPLVNPPNQSLPVAPDSPTRLVVTDGPLRGTTLPLSQAPVLIGRSSTANLVLDDDYVSSHHAQLFRQGADWYVEDLGSTNGTFLNDQPVHEPIAVRVGEAIRIGRTTVELQR